MDKAKLRLLVLLAAVGSVGYMVGRMHAPEVHVRPDTTPDRTPVAEVSRSETGRTRDEPARPVDYDAFDEDAYDDSEAQTPSELIGVLREHAGSPRSQ